MEQKALGDDYKKFSQREFERIEEGRQRDKTIMEENKRGLQQKSSQLYQLEQQNKDVYNRQALENKIHAERNAEEKRRFKDWQKESLKNDYEERIKRKQEMDRMEKEKEKVYADEYNNAVEGFSKNNTKTLETLRHKNEMIMLDQQRTIIPDLNEQRKRDAMNTMKKQFESTEKDTLRTELSRLNKKQFEAKETSSMLKVQMDIRKKRSEAEKNDEKSYKQYVDNTLSALEQRERKIQREKESFKLTYAKELEDQMKEHSKKENTIFNEMDERTLTLNKKNIFSYEAGERNKELYNLPGIKRDPKEEREYFGRYARDQKSNKFAAELGVGMQMGDTASYTSRKPLSNQGLNAFSIGQNNYPNLPKTSMEDGANRRSRGGLYSPKYNILNNQNMTDREYDKKGKGLSKYKSMVDLERPRYEDEPASIDQIRPVPAILLSPRNREEPEYEPTKRADTERRGLGGVSKSIANLDQLKEKEKKEVAFEMPAAQPTIQTPHTSKMEKYRNAPDCLLDINSRLNSRIMGNLRSGNLRTSIENVQYGKGSPQIKKEYKGPIC